MTTATSDHHGEAPATARPVSPALGLAESRTTLAFERTDLSADRTLMAVIRTSLSLISFGFGFVQFFRSLHKAGVAEEVVTGRAVRNFGLSLLLLGVGLLVLGMVHHVRLMHEVHAERAALVGQGLLPRDRPFRISVTLTAAAALLALGVVSTMSMIFRVGPFH